MFLIFGRHRFFKRKKAYRMDFCNHCETEVIAEQFRTFDFFHLYWIPLIPLGLYKHWHCSRCEEDPRKRTKTSFSVKIVGLILLGFFLLSIWITPVSKADVEAIWIMRILLSVGFLCLPGKRAESP